VIDPRGGFQKNGTIPFSVAVSFIGTQRSYNMKMKGRCKQTWIQSFTKMGLCEKWGVKGCFKGIIFLFFQAIKKNQ
jgi:hypothetical protein